MILYHGSNVEVKEPRLLKIQRELDFGKGFYTTSDLDQASRWANRTARRLKQEHAYVSIYDIDDAEMALLKYDMEPMEATRNFLTSETHRMLEDADLAMWEFSERAIFDMWETERITGDPRNSVYLRSE